MIVIIFVVGCCFAAEVKGVSLRAERNPSTGCNPGSDKLSCCATFHSSCINDLTESASPLCCSTIFAGATPTQMCFQVNFDDCKYTNSPDSCSGAPDCVSGGYIWKSTCVEFSLFLTFF
jgi:hypothetical protein